ncbi:MAG: pilin [Candidatus Magasanikbacteria bacterium]
MQKKFKYIFTFLSIILFSFSFVSFSYAKKTLNDAESALNTVSQKTGITEADVTTIGGDVVKMIFFVTGLIFFALMVYAGVRWMTARDNAEAVEKSKNTMIAAVIGVVILTASYAITTFVQDRVLQGKTDSGVQTFGPNTAGGEELGCCLDWVAADPGTLGIQLPTVAHRWTTYNDCKKFGESNGAGDFHSGPEGSGNWKFYKSSLGMNFAQCMETYE